LASPHPRPSPSPSPNSEQVGAAAMLPQLGHAVIGGEALQLSVVELSTMAVRCVLTDCQDWSIALCACTSAEGKVRSTLAVAVAPRARCAQP